MSPDLRVAPRTKSPQSHDDPTLATYAAFVRRYRVLLVSATILGLLAGALLHLAKPERFISSADMVIVATTLAGGGGEEVDQDISTNQEVSIDTALQLLRSDQVLGNVSREIDYPGGVGGLDADMMTRPVVNSRIVRLSVGAPEPELAQRAVVAVIDRFYELRRHDLEASADNRAAAVEAELVTVEAELARRYGLPTEAELAAAESDSDAAEPSVVDIGALVELRAQLHGEQASLTIAEPDPGYVSRPATTPRGGTRSGLAITMSSALTVSLLVGIGAGALHHAQRGERGNSHARAGLGAINRDGR